MKKYSLLWIAFSIMIVMSACEKKPRGGVEKMHWDRDMCERCKMAVSERKYAVQIINPTTNKAYKFDDIGCGVLWLSEEKIPWRKEAIIWITDAKSGQWIDARRARYTDDSITPMAFGFAAYTEKNAPKNHRLIDFKQVENEIFEIEKLNQKKVGEQ